MEYEMLYNDFIKAFPDDINELQEIADSAVAEPSDGMHIMFGMVVVLFLIKLIENDEEKKLREAFAFFEKMAEMDDPMISEVLEFTVLEDIISQGKQMLDRCKIYMGEKTLERCLAVEKFML